MTQPGLILQPDDRALLHLLGEKFLLLNAAQIQRLFPHRSPRALKARLKKLMAARFLNQRFIESDARLFRPEPLYYLGLEGQTIVDPDRSNKKVQSRVKDARNVTSAGVAHMLLADSIQVTFLRATAEYPDYELVDYIPHYDPVWKKLAEHGFPFRPDGYAEYAKNGRTFHCFVEADRGTYRGSHLRRRLDIYRAYARSGTFSVHFSTRTRFRVLFIAPSRGRARSLSRAMSADDTELFWISARHDFESQPLFHPYWLSHVRHAPHSLDEPTDQIPDPPLPIPSVPPSLPKSTCLEKPTQE